MLDDYDVDDENLPVETTANNLLNVQQSKNTLNMKKPTLAKNKNSTGPQRARKTKTATEEEPEKPKKVRPKLNVDR